MSTKTFSYFVLILLSILKLNATTSNQDSLSKWFIDEIFSKYTNQSQSISVNEIDVIIEELTENFSEKNEYDAKKLLLKLNIDQETINKDIFVKLTPSLVWLALEKDTLLKDNFTNSSNGDQICAFTLSQKYLYGSITMIVIWVTSLVSVIIISRFNKGKKLIVLTLNALAVGTLLSDALIHLIPHMLYPHDHDHSHDDHDHSHDDHDHSHDDHDHHGHSHDHYFRAGGHVSEGDSHSEAIWKMFVMVSILFLLMILEFFGAGHSHAEDGGHSHSDHDVHELKPNGKKVHDETNEKSVDNVNTQRKFAELLRGNGLIVFIANLFHKCCDGLVVGAAFGSSLSLGISTALAILFHEIPHELGDYALLRTSGFMNWQIILLNTIGSFSGFCSFLIISAIENQTGIKEWVFAITAGLFLYISLAGMVPKMKDVFKKKDGKRDKLSIALTIFGFWIGTAFMLLLAIFEEDITLNINSCSV